MNLETAVRAAAGGDLDAFAEVTQRFQHMAYGYALSLVHDLGQAQDVVQDALVAAWFAPPRLADPGGLRGLVPVSCGTRPTGCCGDGPRRRAPRRRGGRAAEDPCPDGRPEPTEQARAVLGAIAGLPRPQREVVALFYVHDCSQRDIATFLGLPVTTVNNRLHAAPRISSRGP